MNITRNDIDKLNAEIRIKVSPEDYQEKVDTILKDHRKKANMPGFRPGKVPMGLINKMYRTSVLAEELNKLLSENLYQFIEENKLEVLGNPLPKEDEKIDLEVGDEFEFGYDLGIAPSFDLTISEKDKFNHYKIKVDDELISKYVKDIAKQNGTVQDVTVAEDEDLIHGKFIELDDAGEPLEGGIKHESTISIEFVEEKKPKATLIGLKAGDSLTIDPHKYSRGPADTAKMLGINVDVAEALKSNFKLDVIHIHRMIQADLNQELYDKVFGPGQVTSEEGFREKIAEDLGKILDRDADKKLKKDIVDKFVEKLDLSLPDEFLKRWLVSTNEGLTPEQVEEDYSNYSKDLKWRLIENKIIKDNDVQVEEADVMTKAVASIKTQFASYGSTAGIDDAMYEDFAKRMIAKEDERKKIVEQVIDEKLLQLFKDTFKLNSKEVSFDEFVNLVTGKPPKNKFMDNINNLLKF